MRVKEKIYPVARAPRTERPMYNVWRLQGFLTPTRAEKLKQRDFSKAVTTRIKQVGSEDFSSQEKKD